MAGGTALMVCQLPEEQFAVNESCEEQTNFTCVHNYFRLAYTWRYVKLVKENAYPTTKQTPKNVATKKSSSPQLQSCGEFRTATPTQKEKSGLCAEAAFALLESPNRS